VGKRLSEVLPGEDKYWVESYGQVALTGESIHADHYSPVLKRHYEIFSYRPAPLQFAVVFTDITERKKMEEDIKQRTLELEASNKELESFAYTVSHDLRAPLRAIDGFTKMLVRSAYDKIDQEEKRKFDVIRNNAQKMGLLIDDLLGFSRLGRQALSSSLFNMEDLIKQVWTECRVVAAGRDIELKIDNLPRAFGDEGLMKQVLMNLLSNAIKFTQSRKEAIIDVGGCGKERETVFFVRDNGVGFDMHYSDKLFGVFQRLHSDEEYEGTGVGLAIVQRIIHMHGGRIWADSKIGEGATFYFSLPAAHTHAVKAASSNTLVVLSET
jgi:light-regulated signal transduction histidine kinase (bacteriophytochrome)